MNKVIASWLAKTTSKNKYLSSTDPLANYDLTKILRNFERDDLYATDGFRAHCFYKVPNLTGYYFNRAGRKISSIDGAKYPRFSEIFSVKQNPKPLNVRLEDLPILETRDFKLYEVISGYRVNKSYLDDACSLSNNYEIWLSDNPYGYALHILYRDPFLGVEGTSLGSLGIVTAHAKVMPLG